MQRSDTSSLEISSKNQSVLKLSRNNSGLNSSLSKISDTTANRSSSGNLRILKSKEGQEVTNSCLNYLENMDKMSQRKGRKPPLIKSKLQNYVRNGNNKSQMGLNTTQTIKLDDFSKEKLNLCNNSEIEISDLSFKDK